MMGARLCYDSVEFQPIVYCAVGISVFRVVQAFGTKGRRWGRGHSRWTLVNARLPPSLVSKSKLFPQDTHFLDLTFSPLSFPFSDSFYSLLLLPSPPTPVFPMLQTTGRWEGMRETSVVVVGNHLSVQGHVWVNMPPVWWNWLISEKDLTFGPTHFPSEFLHAWNINFAVVVKHTFIFIEVYLT